MATVSLPPQLTSFTGRTDDLVEIVTLLTDPTCRLLTLVGPGGIGKTRLAIQSAAEAQSHFQDGVCFVALQPVSSTDFLVPALADALHLTFYGPESPRTQLLHYLRPKELLLVLDNFEHLLDDVALLTEILEGASHIKLLATSREALNVREEWVRAVTTMRVPDDVGAVDLEDYDAAQLFAERAHQARGDFVAERERPHVICICRLVEGLPLAIELAAARIGTLSCAQIVEEIQHSMDFLATSLRNVPERHRDMYAVFEPCWDRLPQPQRVVFMRLTVFRGGFERDAAEQVAGASLQVLAALVDKSLLRVTPAGRYEMHELVRQYAEARLLEEVTGEIDRLRDCHCAYYADFLQRREPDLKGAELLRALAEIHPEIDNMRAMWRWAAQRRLEWEIEKSLDSLALFYHIRCWYQEADNAFGMIVDELRDKRTALLGRTLLWQGHFVWSLFEPNGYERGNQLVQEGVSLLRDLDAYGQTAAPLWLLSEFNDNPEMHEEIRQFCLDNLVTLRKRGDKWGTGWALLGLGNVPLLEGAYEEAREYSQEALAIFRELGDPFGIASALQGLIKVANGQGAYLEEKRYAQEALTHARVIGDQGGIVTAQIVMGLAAYKLGAYEEARHLLEQILPLYRELFPSGVWPIAALGEIALALGDYYQARHYLYEALQGAMVDLATVAWVMISIARLLAADGQKERAVELLVAATSSRWGWRYSSEAGVKTLLAELETDLPAEVFGAARRRGQTGDLKVLASAVLDELSEHELLADDVFPTSAHFGKGEHIQVGQPLIDPLSERELEVLQGVAEGLSNREIAQELVVTVGTVKKHLNNIFSKLYVRSRTQAVVRARELDLLS
jgi:predicted ATPase/DNA-binding CsgD family transcriptional regulator